MMMMMMMIVMELVEVDKGTSSKDGRHRLYLLGEMI